MNVTRISEYQSRDMVASLRDLLERAEQGKLKALAFSAKTGPKRHVIGLVGDYWTDPIEALAVATRIEFKCNQLISSREDEERT